MHSHTGLTVSISIFSLCCIVCIVWLRGFCNKNYAAVLFGLVWFIAEEIIVLQMAHSFTRAVQLCTTLKAPCFFHRWQLREILEVGSPHFLTTSSSLPLSR